MSDEIPEEFVIPLPDGFYWAHESRMSDSFINAEVTMEEATEWVNACVAALESVDTWGEARRAIRRLVRDGRGDGSHPDARRLQIISALYELRKTAWG